LVVRKGCVVDLVKEKARVINGKLAVAQGEEVRFATR
jgi:hypothetical protein